MLRTIEHLYPNQPTQNLIIISCYGVTVTGIYYSGLFFFEKHIFSKTSNNYRFLSLFLLLKVDDKI